MWLSIITAAYNAESVLPAAIGSFRSQQQSDVELVIVDDGSTDTTGTIADSIAESSEGITVLHKPNGGTASALNLALGITKGAFISRLDADDVLGSSYLTTMRRFIADNPGYDIYSHDLWCYSPHSDPCRLYGGEEPRSLSFLDLLQDNRIAGPGTFIRRDLATKIGGFREGVYNEDYDLWLRALLANGRHIYCPKPLYRYTVGQESQKSADLKRAIESNISLLTDLLRDQPLDEEQTVAVVQTIDRQRELLRYAPTDSGLVRQAERFRQHVERIVGPQLVDPVLYIIHLFSWMTRPLRRLLLDRRRV